MASTDSHAPQGSYDHPSPMVETISSFPRIHTGVEKPTINTDSAGKADDPFAVQRDGEATAVQNGGEKAASPSSPAADRRLSTDEWGTYIVYFLEQTTRLHLPPPYLTFLCSEFESLV
jgi:hypothetical protein